jgi:hypothetical protein
MRVFSFLFVLVFASTSFSSEYDSYYGKLNELQNAIVTSTEENALQILKHFPQQFDTPVSKYGNGQFESNWTPLLLATIFPMPKLVKKLVEMGANTKFRESKYNRSAVFNLLVTGWKYADKETITQILATLIAAKADLDSPDMEMGRVGLPPLVYAIRDQIDWQWVEMLLEGGANPNTLGSLNLTPAHYATDYHFCQWIGDKVESLECIDGLIEKMNMLIKHGANMNAVSESSNSVTPLQNIVYNFIFVYSDNYTLAVKERALKALKILLGLNVNVCRKMYSYSASGYLVMRTEKFGTKDQYILEAIKLLQIAEKKQGCLQ